MQNDDINSRVVAVIKRGGVITARELLKIMKKMIDSNQKQTKDMLNKAGKVINNHKQVKVKDLVKKGKVETLEINDVDLKTIKKELKKNGVLFSIKKDLTTGNNIIFFQAKDMQIMEHAFKNAVANFMGKDNKRESVMQKLNEFKEKVKNTLSRDKVKEKHQEQSL